MNSAIGKRKRAVSRAMAGALLRAGYTAEEVGARYGVSGHRVQEVTAEFPRPTARDIVAGRGQLAKLPLRDGGEATVDAVFLPYLLKIAETGKTGWWESDGRVYGPSRMQLATYVIGADIPAGMSVDYIDQDPLNCSTLNLAVVTNPANAFNRKVQANNASGYTGVVYDAKTGMYEARPYVDGSALPCGTYSTAEEAAKAYADAVTVFRRLEHFRPLVELAERAELLEAYVRCLRAYGPHAPVTAALETQLTHLPSLGDLFSDDDGGAILVAEATGDDGFVSAEAETDGEHVTTAPAKRWVAPAPYIP